MGMGIGINVQEKEGGEIIGKQEDVGVLTWFTATGKVIPKLLKVRMEDGQIYAIENIKVIGRDHTHYCGLTANTFNCSAMLGARCYYFRLIYYLRNQEWKIVWNNS